jgi:hypothetical protein
MRWTVGTLVGIHLTALAVAPLSPPSDVRPNGEVPLSPEFIVPLNAALSPNWLLPLKMSWTWRDPKSTIRLGQRLECRVIDETGAEIAIVNYPSSTSPILREREESLVRAIADSSPVIPPEGTEILPKGMADTAVTFWAEKAWVMVPETVEQHRLPRDRELFGPTEWSELTAKSLARHLGRRFPRADRVELIRHQDPVVPLMLLAEQRVSSEPFRSGTFRHGSYSVKP